MSLHKGTDKFATSSCNPPTPQTPSGWQWAWPQVPDFQFNYYKLLNGAAGGLAQANSQLKVAIAGAGVAGLVAARELFRCGITNIHIYEASGRIGGRNYSIPMGPNTMTTYEMGAMRMPFFTAPGSGNCVLDYYISNFGITTQDFPDPGSKAVPISGVYVNNGTGPDGTYQTPTMDLWKGGQAPTQPDYLAIYNAWSSFQCLIQSAAMAAWNTTNWTTFWQSVVVNYWDKNFRELAFMPAITSVDPGNPGFFGGLGLTEDQAQLLYVIGVGDGGWGAFYDISCLYVFRTIIFGFGVNHQLIQGTFSDGVFKPGPQYNTPTYDSAGVQMSSPNYLGLQSFAECLFYTPVKSNSPAANNMSLYQACQNANMPTSLFVNNPIQSIQQGMNSQLMVWTQNAVSPIAYDAVIITPTTWALEMSQKSMPGTQPIFSGFTTQQIPLEVMTAIKESHWITSSKVFFPLKQRYWEVSKIPQVISTDTFLQDVYGIAAGPNDPGVILVSYTWEDDATKLESDDDATLGARCINELDRICLQTLGTTISQYVDLSQPATVIHWEQQPTYRACAKLYREMSFDMDYSLLTFNQNQSASSGIYFAGEGYSVEGGWTEPALQSALDAVLNLLNNTGATFSVPGFDFATNYPQWPNWSPNAALMSLRTPSGVHTPASVIEAIKASKPAGATG